VGLVVKKGWKILFRLGSGMPNPLSATETIIELADWLIGEFDPIDELTIWLIGEFFNASFVLIVTSG
jgi:hypothetical protein